MKRKTEQIVIVVFIMGMIFSFFSICSSFFADVYTMTDKQYACEAMKIVNDSLQTSQPLSDTAK